MSSQNCAAGCTSRNRHNPECQAQEVGCTGCRPRPAEYGLLCRRCHFQLSENLIDAPGLIKHLRAQIFPSNQTTTDTPFITGTKTPPAPADLSAIDAADELHATLISWALLVQEEHPAGLRGPTMTGTQWASADRPIGAHTRADITPVTQWLLTHLQWIEKQDWAGEIATDLQNHRNTALARWPLETRPRPVTVIPCPACDRLSLIYQPPTTWRAQAIVQCARTECSTQIDEKHWAHYARVIEQDAKEKAAS
ncbi:MAG TPA: hypothetical protein VK054_10605 [Beutenbergiaceae bacterium]|nr:hypothetical protein [Beutenbergiaceae bacterium]